MCECEMGDGLLMSFPTEYTGLPAIPLELGLEEHLSSMHVVKVRLHWLSNLDNYASYNTLMDILSIYQ